MAVRSQAGTPLADGLMSYAARSASRFHTPGHAGGRGWPNNWSRFMAGAGRLDVTELPSLEEDRSTLQLLDEAQELAAELFGASRTFFLSGGSTLGLQAAVLSAASAGDDVIVPRNAHQSVVHSLVISGANPIYIPVPCTAAGIPLGVTLESLRQGLRRARRPRLAVLMSPSYQGLCVDLPALVKEAHDHGVPVVVDEAHGSHFRFHAGFPRSAWESGADAWVQSAHKTLGALTGAAMLHVGYGAIRPDSVRRALSVLASTSPSYLLLASLDIARREMWSRGEFLWNRAIGAADRMRRMVDAIPRAATVGPSEVGRAGIIGFDPTRLVFSADGLTGWQMAGTLRSCGVEVEYADLHSVCLIIPSTIRRRDVASFAGGLGRVRAAALCAKETDARLLTPASLPNAVMTPREAVLAPSERVLLERAEGRVAAVTVSLCPPGIPLLCPGELVTHDGLCLLRDALAAGCSGLQVVEGLDGGELAVVAEGAVRE